MPHTSRRKKHGNDRKRTEVLDDEGWTRITTKRLSKMTPQSHNVTAREYSPSRDPVEEPYVDLVTLPAKCEVPFTASVADISQRYEKVKSLWLLSDSFTALQAALLRQLETASKIPTCALFGAGSYCGLRQGWIERHEVALVQTAVFTSAVDLIEQAQGFRPSCFAQEPEYNVLDKEFLATLGVTAVDHPAGFEQLPQHSFAYTPGAEQDVELRVLYRIPAILLTSELDLYYRDKEGVAHARHLSIVDPDTGEHDDGPGPWEAEYENNARICERFLRDHDCVRLPELEMANHPFHRQFLYYRKAGEDSCQIP